MEAGNANNFFLDLSMAKYLESLTLRPWALNVGWVIRTLKTVPSNHKTIKIRVVYDIVFVDRPVRGLQFGDAVDPIIFGQWLKLDGLVVHLWESSKITTKVFCHDRLWQPWGVEVATRALLPEATSRGLVVVERFHHRLWFYD